MAQRRCCWRKIFYCLCSFCLGVLLTLACFVIMVVITMNKHTKEWPAPTESVPSSEGPPALGTRFIAPGAVKSRGYSSTPKVFWDEKYERGFWNKLQKQMDRHSQSSSLSGSGSLGAPPLSHSLSDVRNSEAHGLHVLPEALQGFVSSMSRRRYPVLMEPRGHCGGGGSQEEGPLLLLAIKTSALDYDRRQAIRQSWGRAGWVWAQGGRAAGRGAYVHRVFLMGTQPSPEQEIISSELLRLESQQHRDILQWGVWDTPLNGTVRQLLFWTWFRDNCGHVPFVFEGNDEVFVNTPGLVSLLQLQLHEPRADSRLQDFMTGHVVYKGRPDRSPDSQEFIPESFFRGWYPSYTRGAGRLSSALLLRRLLQVSHRVHLFPLEQVYVGMCLTRLNLSPSHHPAFLPSDWTQKQEWPCAAHRVLLLHTNSPTHMLRLWARLSPNTGPCSNVAVAPVTAKKIIQTTGARKHGF